MTQYNVSLDKIDRAILIALQENARLTNVELADRIGLSPSACLRRVNILEKSKTISGYHATINPASLNFTVIVLAQITLTGQSATILSEFENAVRQIPNLLDCFLIAGAKDYLLRIASKDVEDYGNIHAKHLATLPHVHSMESSFVMRTVVNRDLPIALL